MRAFLNAILAFIESENLTDVEFDTVTGLDYGYNQATYDALAEILDARDDVSTQQDKLTAYFTARGVSVSVLDTAKSNVFIGSVLD